MSDLLPNLGNTDAVQINKKMLVAAVGVLSVLIVGGLAYGLASDPLEEKQSDIQSYNTEIPASSELNRFRDRIVAYAPPKQASDEPSPSEPEPTPIAPVAPALLPPQPIQPLPDPNKLAVRQSAISVFDKSSISGAAQPFPLNITDPPTDLASLPTIDPDDSPAPPPSAQTISPFGRAASPRETLLPGTIIKARLDTAIDTTHPSIARARVIEAVFDHWNGKRTIIPQGAILIGAPASNTEYGQERVYIAWTSLTLPDGRVLDMSSTSAGDIAGRGGLPANVDNHYLELFASAALSSIISVSASLSSGDPNDPLTLQQRATQGLASSVNQTGSTLVGRAAAIKPTLTIEPGHLVTIIVNRPISLENQ
ncbi:TrbI/VirB10 family protein [Nisaea sediminum]|uniref:TrbI/VirB10 family protein n=2 Tax=Pseudomonadota TaxID=1224 RepID=UPI00186688EB|nr:TrbI/VirB10 family protein [Nisaea sediminum]